MFVQFTSHTLIAVNNTSPYCNKYMQRLSFVRLWLFVMHSMVLSGYGKATDYSVCGPHVGTVNVSVFDL